MFLRACLEICTHNQTLSSGCEMLCPRFELFKDCQPQLQSLLRFLHQEAVPALGGGLLRVNVPNKRPRQAQHLLRVATSIALEFPGSEVCLHYSLKYQAGGVIGFRSFCQEARNIPGCSVLLVSGSGNKSNFDSCECLEQLAQECSMENLPPLGIAFSPYETQSLEKSRLLRKLNTGLVSHVWLQLGSNMDKLRLGLELLAETGVKSLYGSVFLPSEALLAKQRARPWAGVYLNEEYLRSVSGAEAITVEMIKLYAEFNVKPLVESPIENSGTLLALSKLLTLASAPAASLADMPATEIVGRQLCSMRRWGRGSTAQNNGIMQALKSAASVSPHTCDGLERKTCTNLVDDSMLACEVQTAPSDTVTVSASARGNASSLKGRSIGIVWFRQDLRTHDNPALLEAARQHDEVVAVFVWCPEEEGDATPGRAAQIWLKESIRSLAVDLQRLGSKLVLRRSASYGKTLLDLATELGARRVYFCRRYEPWSETIDQRVMAQLDAHGIKVQNFLSYLLYEPCSVNMGNGYTNGHWGTLMPFYKACLASGKPRRPLPSPKNLQFSLDVHSLPLEALGLETGISKNGENWGASIRAAWHDISESAALQCLQDFVHGSEGLRGYEKHRSRADLKKNPNSKLSAFLRWGQLSPHDLFWAVQDAGLSYEETKTFGRRLFWRDLAYFQLRHFPTMRRNAIRAHYDSARWCENQDLLRRWQQGCTGYPLVDASMRELRSTGWVQQNVRMVAASFLTEFLNISWVEGVKWYEDELVDADLAINSMMWQNAGRCGIDQWNFLISPVEAKAQDPSGEYVRKWIPELARLPTKYVHAPWKAPVYELEKAMICLGQTYPNRCVVDLIAAREEAKQATLQMRRNIAGTWMNDHQGYDVIGLPGGHTTKVFTKQEYRLAKDGSQLMPSAGASKPSKGSGKGRGKRNSSLDQNMDHRAKAPRSEQQLRIDDFCKEDHCKNTRWVRLSEPVNQRVVLIDLDP